MMLTRARRLRLLGAITVAILALQASPAAFGGAKPRRVAQLDIGSTAPEILAPAPVAPTRMEGRPVEITTIEAGRTTTERLSTTLPSSDAQRLREKDRSEATAAIQRLIRQAEAPRNWGSTQASAQAAWLLGLIYLHGSGVPRDPGQAQTWFERAARFDREPLAQAGLAWCAIEGCQGPPNPARAEAAIAKLRARHPARADYLQWVLLSRSMPLQLRKQTAEGESDPVTLPNIALLQKAAAGGDVHARLELGLNDVTNNRIDDALAQFRRAGPTSRAAVANIRVLQARDSTIAPATTTAPQPDALSILQQARKYHRGIGVPANYAEAIRLYRLAESKGSQEARKMLELIFSRPGPAGSFDAGWMQQLAYVDPSSTIPTVVSAPAGRLLYREPTPLYDLLPDTWRQQMSIVDR